MFVDEALARRLETLDATFATRTARAFAADDASAGRPAHAGSVVLAGAVAAWVAPGSVLSKVHGLGMHGSPDDADLDAIEEFYRARGDRRAAIELAPFAGAALTARLEARGYRTEGFEHVLVRALAAEDREPAAALQPGVTVEAVEAADAAARAAWVDVSAEGFFAPAAAPPDLLRYAALSCEDADTTAWLARVDGAPAATGAHSVSDGLCALFGGATRPEARRRGGHRALIAARLAAGARAGATIATAGASPGGVSHRNLEAAGFTVAYTRPLLVRTWE
jgi:hypothetical protein